jgi:hypothetical protein
MVFRSSDRATPVLLPRAPQRADHSVISSASLPPNFRDVTAEKVGTVMAIVGATAAGKGTKPRMTDA